MAFNSKDELLKHGVKGTSSFTSKVVRAGTAHTDTRAKTGLGSRVGRGFVKDTSQMNPGDMASQMSAAQNIDVFEDNEEDDAPGPGYYHDPKRHTAFRLTHKEPYLQRFGSSVERFVDPAVAKSRRE